MRKEGRLVVEQGRNSCSRMQKRNLRRRSYGVVSVEIQLLNAIDERRERARNEDSKEVKDGKKKKGKLLLLIVV